MAERAGPVAGVAVFDFDGSLFDGDLGFEWLRWELLRSPAHLFLMLASAPLWAPLFLRPRWVQHGVGACFWLATLGRPRLQPDAFLTARAEDLRRAAVSAGAGAAGRVPPMRPGSGDRDRGRAGSG